MGRFIETNDLRSPMEGQNNTLILKEQLIRKVEFSSVPFIRCRSKNLLIYICSDKNYIKAVTVLIKSSYLYLIGIIQQLINKAIKQ